MVEPAKTGLVDLEKELTCSVSHIFPICGPFLLVYKATDCWSDIIPQICTEILYQPLTLLDCLHTFCGSCLKEWFSLQVTRASTANPNPFSCPSCRASVRDTRPNAGITTLLEMYLQANPSKGKGEQEKEEMRKRYKPGENVLPKVKRRKERDDEAEDRRMVEEVREMSLRDLGIRGSGSYERGVRHRVRSRVRNGQDGEPGSRDAGGEVARPSTATEAASQARQIEHQSSLRSLLSSSDVDSSDLEEEILRQIMDEGILDGIDLNNIDVSQEDELSEKIADAYRRRHGRRSRARNAQVENSAPATYPEERSTQERQHRRPGRSPNPHDQTQNMSHPPLPRPHLLEVYPTGHGHRRRTSSETRRQTSLNPSSRRGVSSETQRQAARSATDLTNAPQSSPNRRARPADLSDSGRQTRDPRNLRAEGTVHVCTAQAPRSPRFHSRNLSSSSGNARQGSNTDTLRPTPTSNSTVLPSSPRDTGSTTQPVHNRNYSDSVPQDQHWASTGTRDPHTYLEPSISCDRCGRKEIEYELHWNCSQCREGHYNLCLRCYRSGRGCLHWYGFGYKAVEKYRNQEPSEGYPPNYPPPHHLKGYRYLRPGPESLQPATPNPGFQSTSDPKKRLLSGPLCSECLTFTPDCHWRCDVCNEGEWGFCNPCVNQGRCCTHALLPVTYRKSRISHDSVERQSSQDSSMITHDGPLNPLAQPPIADSASGEQYIPLTFSATCSICTYPIPPSNTRFHCPQCRAGDYDIDATCYQRLVHNGKIRTDNGPKGWRRCPSGHRMIIVGFEDSSAGQRRIVVGDLVGGHALEDDANKDGKPGWRWWEGEQRHSKPLVNSTTGRVTTATGSLSNEETHPLLRRYPPDGGVGMHILARWAWWPAEGSSHELAFPKGAEIRECEDINGDWFWGVYCARKGMFPSNYGWVIDTVGMT